MGPPSPDWWHAIVSSKASKVVLVSGVSLIAQLLDKDYLLRQALAAGAFYDVTTKLVRYIDGAFVGRVYPPSSTIGASRFFWKVRLSSREASFEVFPY